MKEPGKKAEISYTSHDFNVVLRVTDNTAVCFIKADRYTKAIDSPVPLTNECLSYSYVNSAILYRLRSDDHLLLMQLMLNVLRFIVYCGL